MPQGAPKYIAITVCVLLAGGLTYMGANSSKGKFTAPKAAHETKEQAAFSLGAYMDKSRKSLNVTDQQQVAGLEERLAGARSTEIPALQSELAAKWEALGNPLIAASYYEQLAEGTHTEASWVNTGRTLMAAIAMSGDPAMEAYLVPKAEATWKKVLEINPGHIQAKADLALCYVNNDANTMQGVQLLKQVLEADPDNVQAIYTLGYLSVRSGQMDKAIERFRKLLSLDPNNPRYHAMLGVAYEKNGQAGASQSEYDLARNLTGKDQAERESIEKLINELKNL